MKTPKMAQRKTVDSNNQTWQRILLLATDRSQSIIGEIVDGQTRTIGYSAYGEQSAQQKVETRLGFNGQLREANIGWYLLGNGYRAYNPRLMRFHSPDSWSPFGGGGLNAYMYCVGDPVNRVDPTGHVFTAIYLAIQENLSLGSLAALTAKNIARRTNGIARQQAMYAIGHSPKKLDPLVRPTGSVTGTLLGAAENAGSPPAYARDSPPSPNSPHVYPGGVAPYDSPTTYNIMSRPSSSSARVGTSTNYSSGRSASSGTPPIFDPVIFSATGESQNALKPLFIPKNHYEIANHSSSSYRTHANFQKWYESQPPAPPPSYIEATQSAAIDKIRR
jgi:RHS repeat-associated protein